MKLWSTKRKKSTNAAEKKGKHGLGRKEIIIISAAGAVIVSLCVALAIYTFNYDKAFINIKIATTTDIIESIITKSVNCITIAPIKTTTQPKTSSAICRFTAF